MLTRFLAFPLAMATAHLWASTIVWNADASGTNISNGANGISVDGFAEGGGTANFLAWGSRLFTITSPGEFLLTLTTSANGDVECEAAGGCYSPWLELQGTVDVMPMGPPFSGYAALGFNKTCQYPSCGSGALDIFQAIPGFSESTSMYLEAGDYRMDLGSFQALEAGAARIAFVDGAYLDAEIAPVPEPAGYGLLIALAMIFAGWRRPTGVRPY